MVIDIKTREIIEFSKDIDIEQNIKACILILFAIYSVVIIIAMKRIEPNTTFKDLIKSLLPIGAWLYLAFSPLFIFLMLRPVSYDFLLASIISLYTVTLLTGAVLILVYGKDKFFEYLGITPKSKKLNYRRNK